ncbi:MAG TPA: N,N-dimethylformamidase beta subunit family domain-containing protein [Solirubrobacteraceae bacterium]
MALDVAPRLRGDELMDVVGYSSRLVVAPGETVRFMVSSRAPRFEAALVRLIHGNPDPRGPGFKEEDMSSEFAGEYPGVEQPLRPGSYVRVQSHEALELSRGFAVAAWIWPTLPGEEEQAIVTRWSEAEQRGFALILDESGSLALRLGADGDTLVVVSGSGPLTARTWYRVTAVVGVNEVSLSHRAETVYGTEPGEWNTTRAAEIVPRTEGLPLLIGACGDRETGSHFNGKIESPEIRGSDGAVVAAWTFGERFDSHTVIDTGPYGLNGTTVNSPLRAVPGRKFSGHETRFGDAPDEFAAIWFHDDDLDDAGWEPTFEFRVPDDLPSAVYAARLRAGDDEDHVPFFVRPPRGRTTSTVALIMPTYTYLAYANDTNTWRGNPAITPTDEILARLQKEDHYAMQMRLKSLYDLHPDESGVALASARRPMVNMRPRYHLAILAAPHAFSADLHIVDWLERQNIRVDILTDEDVHFEGADLLSRYRVVLTGTHPEYTTEAMLHAYEAYLQGAGRLVYLGGNGFYWVTSVDPEHPHIIEVRRGRRGTGLWRGLPGEDYHATTGELGGLWRDRGLAPQRLVGVGFIADGIGRASGYKRLEASHDPRVSFAFEGVADDEVIGDFGLVLGGTGGNEIDRADPLLGTPAHALRVATTLPLGDTYHHAIEEVTISNSMQHASVNPNVYGDHVFFETPGGGAVFSFGSMAWCGGLSHNGYDNNVSRITRNVITRFMSPEPFGDGAGA